jgi:hypothetical protein
MSAKHWQWTVSVAAVAAVTIAGSAWAQVPGADRKCGTTGTSPASAGDPEDRGRTRIATGGPAFVPPTHLMPAVVEVPSPAGAAPSSPAVPAPPTSGVSSSPPAPRPPPAVPGLPPPPASKEEEEKKEKEDDGRPRVEAIQAKGEVPDERLLDIGIGVFDAAVDEDEAEKLAAKGLSADLRKAEGRFVAVHLKKTMEGTGNWGAVRVLPGPGEGTDVFVSGKIVRSTGKQLSLDVEAADATGRRWLKRRYTGEADVRAYRPDRVGRQEPFQDLYNRIANDLLAERDDLRTAEVVTVRRVATLRFASELAPEAFTPFLKPARAGHYSLLRLPAEGDPMVRRVAEIRDRDQMLVDTLNDYYESFYERMGAPYANWRQYSYDEQVALDKINRGSTLKKILGAAAMLGGIVLSGSDSQGGRAAGDVALLGGYAVLQAGMQQAQEKALHEAALKELAVSVDGDVAPLLVEVEGHQLRLTGSAEKQFTEWRELLHRVFTVETGVPDDPNAPAAAPAPPSS